MPVLTRTRTRFRNIAIALGAVCLLTAMYLLFPFGPDKASLYAELEARRLEANAMERELRPLRDLPGLLSRSEKDVSAFYRRRLPGRFSRVTEEVGRLAAKNGVRLDDVKYETVPIAETPSLQEVQITATLSGRYANIAKFINAVERNEIFFVVHALELGDEESGDIRLDLQMETYLRPRTAEDFGQEERTGD
jgi:type IV pilus assembly protein PilO